MASCFLSMDPTSCLYEDSSTSCSSYLNKTHFAHVPDSVLASIHSASNCTWLESIITGNYTAQDVWRDLLPAMVYNPNFTNCYGQQYMDHFNLSRADDRDYSFSRHWLIPRGLSSLARPCLIPTCQRIGATGNADIAGIGVSGFSGGSLLVAPKDISREVTIPDTDAGRIRV